MPKAKCVIIKIYLDIIFGIKTLFVGQIKLRHLTGVRQIGFMTNNVEIVTIERFVILPLVLQNIKIFYFWCLWILVFSSTQLQMQIINK